MMNSIIKCLLKNKNNAILITSGEGNLGVTQKYTGKRDVKSIRDQLKKERCGGDRWAEAKVFSHNNGEGEAIFINIETGEWAL